MTCESCGGPTTGDDVALCAVCVVVKVIVARGKATAACPSLTAWAFKNCIGPGEAILCLMTAAVFIHRTSGQTSPAPLDGGLDIWLRRAGEVVDELMAPEEDETAAAPKTKG